MDLECLPTQRRLEKADLGARPGRKPDAISLPTSLSSGLLSILTASRFPSRFFLLKRSFPIGKVKTERMRRTGRGKSRSLPLAVKVGPQKSICRRSGFEPDPRAKNRSAVVDFAQSTAGALFDQVEYINPVLLNPHVTVSRPDGDDGVAAF